MIKKLWVICWVLIQGIGCFGEEITLEQAIPGAFAYVRERIPDGSSLSVQPVTSDNPKPGAYIHQEWLALAVNDEALSVVEGQNPGDFSISGTFETFGSSYILRIRLVETSAGQIRAQGRFDITRSPLLTNLIGYSEETELSRQEAASAEKANSVGLPGSPGDNWITIGMGYPMILNTITGEPLIKSYGSENYEDPIPFGMGFSLMVSVQLFEFFALQTDITYAWNTLSDGYFWGSFDDNRLQATLLAKLTIDLWGIFGIEPFAGVYVDFPLGSLDYALDKEGYGEYQTAGSTDYSIQPGFVAGIRLYSWFFFTDYRFGVDFKPTSAEDFNGQSGDLYSRTFFTITIGIQWGFLKKKR